MHSKEMEKSESTTIYHVTMESGGELGVKTDFLVASYTAIDSKAKQLAPREIQHELLISQDAGVKTTFHVKVSSRMAPYLVNAIQQQNEPGYGIALKSYFNRLQEQIMAQMFAGIKDVIG